MKGLREAQACTLEQANQYLEQVYEPWWEAHCTVAPAEPADAHRPLAPEHDLASILSVVQTRHVQADYTVQFQGSKYQIQRADICNALRRARARVQQRLDGTLHMSFQGRVLRFEPGATAVKAQPAGERHAGRP